MDHDLARWLEALEEGLPFPDDGSVPDAIAASFTRLRARLQQQDEVNDALQLGVLQINESLGKLAQLQFDSTLEPHSPNDAVNGAFMAINMLGEELDYALASAERARRDAVAANHTKTVFLANMSHELRTPLNAIIGYGEMVLEEIRESKTAAPSWDQDLTRVLDSARHLLNVISDILDLSKIEAGHMTFELEDLCPAAVLEHVSDAITPTASANGTTIVVIETSHVRVRADRLRLTQILLNLASNAAKFTQNGRIELGVRTEGDAVIFTVADTGIGIEPEHLAVLFTPFVQFGKLVPGTSGTGLGLSIARELCRQMQGDILVHSEPGRGSTFSVYLPATPAEAAG